MRETPRDRYYSKKELLSQRWTRRLIAEHLDPPDDIRRGRVARWIRPYRKAWYSCVEHLYLRERVKATLDEKRGLGIVLRRPRRRDYGGGPYQRHAASLDIKRLKNLDPELSRRDAGILEMIFSGTTQRGAASRYGVSRQLVAHIKRRAVRTLIDAGMGVPEYLLRWRRKT